MLIFAFKTLTASKLNYTFANIDKAMMVWNSMYQYENISASYVHQSFFS